jgi:hypothetical protein
VLETENFYALVQSKNYEDYDGQDDGASEELSDPFNRKHLLLLLSKVLAI